MPIRKHIVKAHTFREGKSISNKGVFVQIPETLCSALGISEDTPLKVYSNNNGYSFTVEVALSFENMVMLNRTLEKNIQLNTENNELKKSVESLKQRVYELENRL